MSSGVEVNRAGDAWTFLWADQGYKVVLDQLREHTDDLYAEIRVLVEPPPEGMRGQIHWAKLNLSSTISRDKLAKFLNDRTHTKNGFWNVALEQVCALTAEQYREGEPFYDLADGDVEVDVDYLIDRMLPWGETTAIFGDGDSGKGWLALAMALALRTGESLPNGLVPLAKVRCLYLDWETNYKENKRRLEYLCRGIGIARPDGISYRFMTRSLADDLATVRTWAARTEAEFIVIDSAAPATGGEVKDSEPVNRFMAAIRYLPGTKLVIGHVSKETAEQKGGKRGRMIGSIFYENLARNCWEVRSDTKGNPICVGLFHRKANLGAKQKDFGLKITFDDQEHSAIVAAHNIMETPDIAEHASLFARMRYALRNGALDTEQLAVLLAVTESTVRTTARRMPDVMSLGPAGGRGKKQLWGLTHDGKP